MATIDAAIPLEQSAALPQPITETVEGKTPYKSWRKKFRKMRRRFDDAIKASNDMYREEHKAVVLARRLQEQNDQLLDLLLDINQSARLPLNARYDLRSPSPPSADVPALETDYETEPEAVQQRLRQAREDLASGAISPEEFADIESSITRRLPKITTTKSLSHLEKTVPHTQYTAINLPSDIIGDEPAAYLTPQHEEEYLSSLDAALIDPTLYNPEDHSGRSLHFPDRAIPTEKELQIRNPVSVYNWLRRNQPQVFLQDKDHENASEKSSHHARGAGQRAGKRGKASGPGEHAATPTRATHTAVDTDHADEDGFVPETGTGSGRRKTVSKDDEAYRPKGGSSRPAKRKRESEGGGKRKYTKHTAANGGT